MTWRIQTRASCALWENNRSVTMVFENPVSGFVDEVKWICEVPERRDSRRAKNEAIFLLEEDFDCVVASGRRMQRI